MRRARYVGDETREQWFERELTRSPLPAMAAPFVERLTVAAVDELRGRYELGQFLHRVRYDAMEDVPFDAFEGLARIFGMHPSALRRCARVTEVFTVDEFESILALRDARGLAVTWSHFEVLTLVRGREARFRLAQSIVAERLSVRDLSARIRRNKKQSAA